MNASDDLVLEHALLVSRGVRPMALVAYVGVGDNEAREAHAILTQAVGSDRAIPFVVPWQEMECALAGFAAETWVIDLLEWICSLGVGSRRHHQVMGELSSPLDQTPNSSTSARLGPVPVLLVQAEPKHRGECSP